MKLVWKLTKDVRKGVVHLQTWWLIPNNDYNWNCPQGPLWLEDLWRWVNRKTPMVNDVNP